LISPDATGPVDKAERRRGRLALVTYWAEAGIASTAAGAWASTALSGRVRILVWAGITTLLAAVAILFAGPAVGFLSRCYRVGQARRQSNRS
jgi:hypothetical protein